MTVPEEPSPSMRLVRLLGDDIAVGAVQRTQSEEKLRVLCAKEPVERYDYVVDSSDFYVVWDRVANLPVVTADGILAFPTAEDAAAAIRRLNLRRPLGSASENQPPTTEKNSAP